ncbi:hypothetical protein [Radicibacter daui]|uniref:hypothetical protein n=1 Tax=Radicibacter daui TaxID=3064829 RepID=UPI00404693C4
MTNIVSRLVNDCNQARRSGADFPTVWTAVLKEHTYIAGSPRQQICGTTPVLTVPLITGQDLVFDGEVFSLS